MKEWSTCHDAQASLELLPVHTAWQLNERYYGELQGLNKQATVEKFGPEQVKIWRRSYASPPPDGESLKETAARTLPYFHEKIEPELLQGKNILVCAHGNSLRSIIMSLEKLSEDQIVALELATGEPIIYRCEKEASGQSLTYTRAS